MRAVLCKSWCEPEDLVMEAAPSPPLRKRGVRIAVHASGINFADTLTIKGLYQERPEFPFAPGIEVAGEVLEVAGGVTRCRAGDRVLGVVPYGGYADEVVAPEDGVFPLPEDMDFTTAAGFAVAYGTSHVALRYRADLQPGETLVVHGAAGGVGLTAVEIGKLMGATVIASAGGPDKLAVAREHGADHTVDYRQEDVRARIKELTDGRGADVIYDPVGGDVFDASLRALAWGGRILVIGFASGRIPEAPVNRLLIKNASAVGVLWGAHVRFDPETMKRSFDELLGWYAAGRLRPHISAVMPLERAGEALRMMIDRKTTGKVVLTSGRS